MAELALVIDNYKEVYKDLTYETFDDRKGSLTHDWTSRNMHPMKEHFWGAGADAEGQFSKAHSLSVSSVPNKGKPLLLSPAHTLTLVIHIKCTF